MSSPNHPAPASFLDCPVCSQIDALETSFSKYAWPDQDLAMSPAVHQLVPAEDIGSHNENHHIQVCTCCGTFYRFDYSYEYLVNGSEDTTTLLRLAPANARKFLTPEAYESTIQAAFGYLQQPDVRLQRFGGACLAAHHLHNSDLKALQDFLLTAPLEAANGAVIYLLNLIDNYADCVALRAISGLQETLVAVIQKLQIDPAGEPRHDLGKLVGYLLSNLFPKST